jgi:Acyl-protein synthetase, LuxE
MAERESLQHQIIALTQDDTELSDVAFNDLAVSVFQFQFEHNTPYRRYCERRGVRPDRVQQWLDIPPVPTAAFKEAKLVAGDAELAEAVFLTSGTTRGAEKRGAHYVLDLSVYRASLLPTFNRFVLADADEMTIVSLIPEWTPGGQSSLGYMASIVMQQLGDADSWCAVDQNGINFEQLTQRLQNLRKAVCLIGTSLAFVHWFEYLIEDNITLHLPTGSRLMDTGGFKGSQRAVSNVQLRQQYEQLLSVSPQYVINEYGMTEMLSQFYDSHLLTPARVGVKSGPSWVRSAVVHPETLEPVRPGIAGLLRHFDLANVFSVSAIQTEDMARGRSDGFELLGRAPGATPRGCSIAMDMFLSASRA